jgi:hypothetical protein
MVAGFGNPYHPRSFLPDKEWGRPLQNDDRIQSVDDNNDNKHKINIINKISINYIKIYIYIYNLTTILPNSLILSIMYQIFFRRVL